MVEMVLRAECRRESRQSAISFLASRFFASLFPFSLSFRDIRHFPCCPLAVMSPCPTMFFPTISDICDPLVMSLSLSHLRSVTFLLLDAALRYMILDRLDWITTLRYYESSTEETQIYLVVSRSSSVTSALDLQLIRMISSPRQTLPEFQLWKGNRGQNDLPADRPIPSCCQEYSRIRNMNRNRMKLKLLMSNVPEGISLSVFTFQRAGDLEAVTAPCLVPFNLRLRLGLSAFGFRGNPTSKTSCSWRLLSVMRQELRRCLHFSSLQSIAIITYFFVNLARPRTRYLFRLFVSKNLEHDTFIGK